MSKSKGNVVDPVAMCARYGADTVRLYMLFAAPPEKDLEWSDQGIAGASRFLNRVHVHIRAFVEKYPQAKSGPIGSVNLNPQERHYLRKTHQTLKHITEDFEKRWHFNTDIAKLMELWDVLGYMLNLPSQGVMREEVAKNAWETLVLMLAPFAPHVADELWESLGHSGSTLRAAWPKFDAGLAAEEELEIPVQVNGKLRARIRVPATATDDEIRILALDESKVREHLEGRQLVKAIIVPKKLVNVVVR
jgi:leucyl-tRNA synthetase